MQGREWLYYLVDENGKSYRKENGLVVAKSDPKPLRYTPDGWQDIAIGWERNMDKYGSVRNFSLPLGFVLDGADIIRHLFYTSNFEQKVYLLIKRRELYIDNNEFYFWYKFFYRGELDFTTSVDEETKMTINIMEGWLSKDLKANEKTDYEIPLDSPTSVYVKMDGILFQEKSNYVNTIASEISGQSGLGHYLPIAFINKEGDSVGIVNANQSTVDTGSPFFLKAFLSTTIKLKGSVRFKVNQYVELFSISLLKTDINGVNTAIKHSVFNPVPQGNFINIEYDETIPMEQGESLSLRATGAATSNSMVDRVKIYYEETTLEAYYNTRYRSTFIRARLSDDLHGELVAKMTGDINNAKSELLSRNRNLAITSGDGLRSLPGAVIKTNFSDFATSFNVVLNAGYGIVADKIVFEDKSYFFNSETVIPLGKVKNVKTTVATDILVNTIEIGYPDQTYDGVNGKSETNTTQKYSSPVKRISKALDLKSVYRADAYGIEYTRANLDGKTTTDSESDNDVFILNIDYGNPQTLTEETDGLPIGTVYYNLKRAAYDSIEGIAAPLSIFNIEDLTPKRLLYKHGRWIRSLFFGFEADYLVYETTDKNRQLKTIKGGTVVDEDANVLIGSLEAPLLQPVVFEFETETPTDLVEIMEANPNRCFSFIHPNGNTYKGFNLTIGIAPNTEESQVFRLISTADNDLTTLQYG